MKASERLAPLLKNVPDELREEASQRLIRYLEIVIAIADEARARQDDGLTDEPEPPTLSYSV